jgi:hypothetical protein
VYLAVQNTLSYHSIIALLFLPLYRPELKPGRKNVTVPKELYKYEKREALQNKLDEIIYEITKDPQLCRGIFYYRRGLHIENATVS